MSDLPMPIPGNWDHPQPTTAMAIDRLDFVSTLNQLGHRLPMLISALERLRGAIPEFARDEITGEITPARRAAMVTLCREPGYMLLDLASLCARQAEQPPRNSPADGCP